MSNPVLVTIDAFRVASQQWETVGVINLDDIDYERWGYFGKNERKIDVIQDGIEPQFSNHQAYPRLRFSLNQVTEDPVDLSLRMPRLGHTFVITGLTFGVYMEIDNAIDPYSTPQWGAFFKGIADGIIGDVSLSEALYISYEDLTNTANTTSFAVKMRRYVPGTLSIYINGVRGRKWYDGITGTWNYKELVPSQGTFEITGFYEPGSPLIVDYYYQPVS